MVVNVYMSHMSHIWGTLTPWHGGECCCDRAPSGVQSSTTPSRPSRQAGGQSGGRGGTGNIQVVATATRLRDAFSLAQEASSDVTVLIGEAKDRTSGVVDVV